MNVSSWPEIVYHFHAAGDRCGYITVAEELNLSVCFLQKETLKSVSREAENGTQRRPR
jgi:hypothetical protein